MLNGDPEMPPPMTPSKSTSSKQPINISGVRRLFLDNKLKIDDEKAYNDCGAVIRDDVKRIIQGARGSTMKEESRENLHEVCRDFATSNELTFIVELWGVLLHKTREVKDLDPQGRIRWIAMAWKADQLRANWQADFVRECVPAISTTDPVYIKLLASLPRIQNPKPDLTYGLKGEAFTETERQINNTESISTILSNDLYHVWFVVEGKSSGGTIEDAENQCCRAGAAMVNARMQFNARAAPTNVLVLGADSHSFAFSLALVPSKAHMFVHWAEVKGQTNVIFHMNLVDSYDFRATTGDAFGRLRHDMDNVLDWGTLERKIDIQKVCACIAKRLTGETESDDSDGVQSPPKRRRGRPKKGSKQ